jgi:hypothetical protein
MINENVFRNELHKLGELAIEKGKIYKKGKDIEMVIRLAIEVAKAEIYVNILEALDKARQ